MATVEQIREMLQATKVDIVASITQKLDKKFDDFKKEIEETVSAQTTTIEKLKEEYDLKLEDSAKQTEEAKQLAADLKKEVTTLKENVRKNNLITEYHNKKRNIIVGGFPDRNEWEKTEDTRTYVEELLFDILKVPNAHNIDIIACHRLPRKPYEAKTRAQQLSIKKRPIIFKVAGENAKQAIFNELRKLRAHNDGKARDDRIYVDHSKEFAEQKKALIDDFKTARKNMKKARWRVNYQTAEYCLYVSGKRVLPKGSPNSATIETAEHEN